MHLKNARKKWRRRAQALYPQCVYDNWKEMTNAVAWIRCFDCTSHYDIPVFVLIFYRLYQRLNLGSRCVTIAKREGYIRKRHNEFRNFGLFFFSCKQESKLVCGWFLLNRISSILSSFAKILDNWWWASLIPF